MPVSTNKRVYEFGSYRLDASAQVLYSKVDGRPISLTARVRAAALEPSRPVLSALIGMVLIYERHYDEAIEQLDSTLEMDAALPTAHTYLALAYLRRGNYDEAARHLAFVRTPTPGSFGYVGQVHALAGRRADALAEAERLLALSRERYVPAYDIATIYAALGDAEQTFLWLERAFDDKSTLIAWLPWDAVFDGIRADPRYSAMVARLSVCATSRGPCSPAR